MEIEMQENIEHVLVGELVCAIIIRSDYSSNGISFFTDKKFSQQLGYMNRPKGYKIQPHSHNVVNRKIELTNEVLFIKHGEVRVDFYDTSERYFESRILYTGDVILLANGGHGFEMLKHSEIIEVKQGPYAGEEDKKHFKSIAPEEIKFHS